jgi:hypothetical protein
VAPRQDAVRITPSARERATVFQPGHSASAPRRGSQLRDRLADCRRQDRDDPTPARGTHARQQVRREIDRGRREELERASPGRRVRRGGIDRRRPTGVEHEDVDAAQRGDRLSGDPGSSLWVGGVAGKDLDGLAVRCSSPKSTGRSDERDQIARRRFRREADGDGSPESAEAPPDGARPIPRSTRPLCTGPIRSAHAARTCGLFPKCGGDGMLHAWMTRCGQFLPEIPAGPYRIARRGFATFGMGAALVRDHATDLLSAGLTNHASPVGPPDHAERVIAGRDRPAWGVRRS